MDVVPFLQMRMETSGRRRFNLTYGTMCRSGIIHWTCLFRSRLWGSGKDTDFIVKSEHLLVEVMGKITLGGYVEYKRRPRKKMEETQH